MRRSNPRAGPVLVALAALSAGCQDYQFNPVGHCLIQPGTERVTLSSVSSADVLFVVDDSGSMGGKQAKLAAAFGSFIGSLGTYNEARVQNGLEPFEFHIAVTTTSVFHNAPSGATCQASCGGVANVCCLSTGQPLRAAKACPTGTGCGAGFACKTDCRDHAGEAVCCDPSGAPLETVAVACSAPGAACGDLRERYRFPRQAVACGGSLPACGAGYTCVSGCGGLGGAYCCGPSGALQLAPACQPGIATEGTPYPRGAFVGLGTNPRVLHYDKGLFGRLVNGAWTPVPDPATATNAQGFTRAQLEAFFRANVNVGTCGSGQEQALQAARLAIASALAGEQRDPRDGSGAVVAAPGGPAHWPHENAKLVVVFVGDEDDCSSPADAVRGVILTGPPSADSCVADAALPLDEQKEFRVEDVVAGLEALGRPLGAAFVVSTAQTSCLDEACTAGLCCDTACTGDVAVCRNASCGGQGAGGRLLTAAGVLRRGGADVVAGSICDPGDGAGFAPILLRVAEIVKPPSALLLPTQPADAGVALLRITRGDGTTRKRCNGPARPPLTPAEARAQGYDWWFTATREQATEAQRLPSSASRFVYINHETGRCEAGPGETYEADYLGVVPAGGCTSDASCAAVLGGAASEWTCFAGLDGAGACVAPSASAAGTCLCGGRATHCPGG